MWSRERVGDDSLCGINSAGACNVGDPEGFDAAAAGGGPSNCAIFTSGGSCSKGYPIPAYQAGFHASQFPTVRTIPDVSLFASNGQNCVAVLCVSVSLPHNQNRASCTFSRAFLHISLARGTSVCT